MAIPEGYRRERRFEAYTRAQTGPIYSRHRHQATVQASASEKTTGVLATIIGLVSREEDNRLARARARQRRNLLCDLPARHEPNGGADRA